MKKNIGTALTKLGIALILTTAITGSATAVTSVQACGEEGSIPYLEGEHSEITTVEKVDYQEGTGTYFFITQGSVEFWVIDIKEAPFSQQQLNLYKQMYEGQKVQIDFVVKDGSITTIAHHLVPATPAYKIEKP